MERKIARGSDLSAALLENAQLKEKVSEMIIISEREREMEEGGRERERERERIFPSPSL